MRKATDLEIAKLNAAKKFYEHRDYNCVKGKYYDPQKQKKYEEDLKEKNEKLKGKRNCLFNPVNGEVYDKEKLDLYDQSHENSKHRYQLRPQIEKYYHEKLISSDVEVLLLVETLISFSSGTTSLFAKSCFSNN